MDISWQPPEAWKGAGATFADVTSVRTSPWTAMLAARETQQGQSVGVVIVDVMIKTFTVPRDIFQDPARIASEREKFLAAAKVHKELSDHGAKAWVPVYHLSEDPENTAFVMKKCGPSLQDYLANRLNLTAGDFYLLVQSVLQGLNELVERQKRSHGNLKPANVLVACAGESPPYRLSDPAPKGEEHSANDLYSLGTILYQLIENREYDPLQPLIPTARWDRFGGKRDRWMQFMSQLLSPNGWQEPLGRVIKEAQRLKPAAKGKKAVVAVLLLAVAAGVGIGAWKVGMPLLAKYRATASNGGGGGEGPATASGGNVGVAVDAGVKKDYDDAVKRYNDARDKYQAQTARMDGMNVDRKKSIAIARESRNFLPDPRVLLVDTPSVKAAAEGYGKAAEKLNEALAEAQAEESQGQTAQGQAAKDFEEAKSAYGEAKSHWDQVSSKLTPRFAHPKAEELARQASTEAPNAVAPTDMDALRNATVAFRSAAQKLIQAASTGISEEAAAQNRDKLKTAFDQALAKYTEVNNQWEVAAQGVTFDISSLKTKVDDARRTLPAQVVLTADDENQYRTLTDKYAAAAQQVEDALKLLNDKKSAGDQTTADVTMAIAKGNEAVNKHDYPEALTWYKKAANLGSAEAMCQVGLFCETGEAGEKDLPQALRWYQQAADHNSARGMALLAAMYENGRAVDKDIGQAVQWYRKSAALKYAPAMVNLGVYYENGEGVEKNFGEAKSWYSQAAELDNAAGMFHLGALYDSGHGVPVDHKQALTWYTKAAEKKSAAAANAIGDLYFFGNGVDVDYAAAMKWYRQAADAGFATGMCNVGTLYDNGKGVPLDHAEAFKWFQKGANAGSGMAMYNLGILYETGRGVDKSTSDALVWYRKAAKSDDGAAQASALDRLGRLGYPQ